MKKLYVALVVIVCLSCKANAESLNGEMSLRDFDTTFKYGRLLFERPFIGSIVFEDVPRPLTAVRVTFDLTVPNISIDEHLDKDWELKFSYSQGRVALLGDSVFVWPAPHAPGDKMTISTEVIPLASGTWGIAIYLDKPEIYFHHLMKYTSSIGIYCCMNPAGELIKIRKGSDVDMYCGDVVMTQFFVEDSLIVRPYRPSSVDEKIDFTMTFVPTPRMGETSSVVIRLRPNVDITESVVLRINSKQIEILQAPSSIPSRFTAGNTYELNFQILPREVSDDQALTLSLDRFVIATQSAEAIWVTGVKFIYHDNGELRYVNDKEFGHVKASDRPKSFPKSTDKQYRTITVRSTPTDK